MEPGVVIAIAGFVVALAVAVYQMQSHRRRDRRGLALLSATPRRPVGKVELGAYQKVVGVAEPLAEPLESPLTKRPCIGYVLRVTELLSNGTREIIDEQKTIPFRVEDPTGKAVVRHPRPILLLELDEHGEEGLWSSTPPELRALLEQRGEDPGRGIAKRCFRYSEGVIAPGERVAVLGVVGREEPDATATTGPTGYRGGSQIILSADAERSLYVSDHASARV